MRDDLPYPTQTYIYIHLMEYAQAKIVGHDDACPWAVFMCLPWGMPGVGEGRSSSGVGWGGFGVERYRVTAGGRVGMREREFVI